MECTTVTEECHLTACLPTGRVGCPLITVDLEGVLTATPDCLPLTCTPTVCTVLEGCPHTGCRPQDRGECHLTPACRPILV